MDLTALGHIFNTAADRVADMAIAGLWQGVLIAGALALLLHFVPRIAASYRFAAWTAAFVALIGLSLFSLMPKFFAGPAHVMQAKVIVSKPLLVFDARWSLAIAGLWVAVSLFRTVDLAIHSVKLRKLWKDARPVQVDARVQSLLAATAANSARGAVEVCTTTTLQRPSVIGFFRPRILIPDWLFARLSPSELEQIVLHEGEHLRRRDDWTNLVQKVCLALFPLNPALMWIERRLCREREMACDEEVVRVTRAPRAYAACLASMAERGMERRVEALSLGAWQRRPELVHRVQSILRSKGRLNPAGARVMLGTLGCGLLVGSIELARSPQLVAFVPQRSVVAANEAKHLKPAITGQEIPVHIASAGPEKIGSRNLLAVSRYSSDSESPAAMNVAVRQPSEARAIALKAPESRGTSNGAPMRVLAKATQRDAKDSQDQQWLVLTEFKQVETSSDNAGLISDYNTGATTVNGAPALQDQQSVTVTQLIFKVSPSRAGSSSATKPKANSSASEPGFATFRDGWFVIQL